jgi:dTDP-4-amino-4,6-dideoxygalactose transaminase
VSVDSGPATCLMDVAQAELGITPRAKAILPLYLYSRTVDMDPPPQLAAPRGTKAMEDVCQAHGAECEGCRAGCIAEAATFILSWSNNLGVFGEDRFITRSKDELARRMQAIRDHSIGRRNFHDLNGFNGRL